MSGHIERVAKAIAAADGYDTWEDAHERTVSHYSSLARAAIEAMEAEEAAHLPYWNCCIEGDSWTLGEHARKVLAEWAKKV